MGGKAGDLISILPCLYAEFKESGQRPELITTVQYADVTKPIPWMVTTPVECSYDFLGNLVRFAKARGRVDFIPQQHSVGYPLPSDLKSFPSFQYFQWSRMGRLRQWTELTLELPRTGTLAILPEPFILLADHSQSSPFNQKEDLFESLVKAFPGHRVLRLSSIRTPHPFDFLALYDASDLIVTIDTMHLHLSRATKTPVIALVTDVPGTWWGSAYHPRFALHVRYSDYALRKGEILHVAKKELTRRSQKVMMTA